MTPLLNTIIILQHTLISFIGIVGNVLVLIVYKKKLKDNETITFFIIHLAITDLACCLFLIPINCYHELNIGKIDSDFMCKFHSFLNILNVTYSCLLMALVAFERYLCIIWPFSKLLTKFRSKILMAFLFTLCLTIGMLGSLGIGIYHQVLKVSSKNSSTSFVANFSSIMPYDGSMYYVKGNDVSRKFMIDNQNRSTKILYQNKTLEWMATNNCFPNNKIIPVYIVNYVRLFQNFIVAACFSIIFVLYAFICVFVSKRRQLKANRANYYTQILMRSKQNTYFSKSEPSVSRNNSLLNKNGIEEVNSLKPKIVVTISQTGEEPRVEIASFINTDIPNIDDDESERFTNENKDNKSTQTVASSIAQLKNSKKYKSSSPTRKVGDEIDENNNKLKPTDENQEKLGNVKSSVGAVSEGVIIRPRKKRSKRNSRKRADSTRQITTKSQKYTSNYINYSNILMANLKTALMLFVVTIIMAIVYTPALLTSLGYITYNPIHWNIIYINNAANPLVYSFLNSNFRKSLKNSFGCFLNRLI